MSYFAGVQGHSCRATPRRTLAIHGFAFVALSIFINTAPAAAEPGNPDVDAPVQTSSAPAASEPPAEVGNIEAITVTATRVNREGYSAPTPTLDFDTGQLDQRAATNIGDFLDELPSFRPTTQPSTNGSAQRSKGSIFLDLRGLGSSRTLVLVDGQRFVPEMDNGLAAYNVNLNQIPTMMLDRIEVVTGGASAQWGSDAVAGVVNVLLKKKFVGFEMDVQGGLSTHGDDGTERIGIVAGRNFANDRINAIFSLDLENDNGVGPAVSNRDWARGNYNIIPNPCPNKVAVSAACPQGGNGQPTNLILPNVQFSTVAPGGLITNTALKGTTFLSGGVPTPFTYGQFVGSGNPGFMQGGSQPGINYQDVEPISNPVKRAVTYERISAELSEHTNAFLDLSYAYSYSTGPTISTVLNYTIQNNNAYLPPSIQAQMASLGLTSFALGRYNPNIVASGFVKNETPRIVAGLDGELAGNWKWSVAAGYGYNANRLDENNVPITANNAFAANAVVNNGQIVCAATVPGPAFNPAAAGCVPMNVFGPGSVSSAARAYVYTESKAAINYGQAFTDANISGEPFNTWAGPISIASGLGYRYEYENYSANAISSGAPPLLLAGNNGAPFSGLYRVGEVFGETVVPLLKDSIVGEALDLNAAVRYADYAGDTGGQTMWKYGATYRPFDGFLLRAARSLDIRAPNIFERSVPGNNTGVAITYGPSSVNIIQTIQGNPDLKPEDAYTTSYGFSYQPPYVPGLGFSVDRYSVDTKGLISTLTSQAISNNCVLQHLENFCSLITLNAAGVPTNVLALYYNLSSVDLSGLDIQASYKIPLGGLSDVFQGDSLSLGFSGTYVDHVYVNTGLGAATVDRAGELGPNNPFAMPHFRSTTSLTFTGQHFSVMTEVRGIRGGVYDKTYTPLTINNNNIPGRTYVDMTGTYEIRNGISAFVTVNNLFDKDPPIDPSTLGSPTNPVYFDPIGRVIIAGIRVRM